MEPSGVADGGVSPRDQLRHAGLSHCGTAITAIALARLDDPTPASSPTMESPSSLAHRCTCGPNRRISQSVETAIAPSGAADDSE